MKLNAFKGTYSLCKQTWLYTAKLVIYERETLTPRGQTVQLQQNMFAFIHKGYVSIQINMFDYIIFMK